MRRRVVPALILVCLALAGGWTIVKLWPAGSGHSAGREAAPAGLVETDSEVVALSRAKILAAGIDTCAVERRMVGRKGLVPGRIQYDDTRHVAVKASTAGILHEVLVKPGDNVAEGQVLAVVSSPEVGNARADVLRRRAEYELARKKFEWEQASWEGLEKLLASIRAGEEVQAISDKLRDVPLGEYRDTILAAYTRSLLARQLAQNVSSAAATGAVSSRVVQERHSERDAAAAALQAVMEQSLFEAGQKRMAAQLQAEDAGRRLLIAQQLLQTLLGYPEEVSEDNSGRPLSHVLVRAPFAGTVEAKNFSSAERIDSSDSLFVLADTSQLWVSANIREREWPALAMRPGQPVKVTVPALQGKVLQATVYYIGREVSPATNAVPLVATIGNAEGLLRPGQFVQVELPLGAEHSALTVPSSAIVEHEGESFLFVPNGERSYRRIDVRTGVRDGEWTEITTGVSPDQQVVIRGAFLLKSELLLEGETE